MDKAKQIIELKQLLTGNRKNDRLLIFQHLLKAASDGEQELMEELMRLGLAYLPNELEDLTDEFVKYEEIYTPAFLNITVFKEVTLVKRLALMNFLVKFTNDKEKSEKGEDEQVYSFEDDFQKQLFDKITGGRIKYRTSEYPYSLIYLQYGLLIREYGDNVNAYTMFSKAHVWNPVSSIALFQLLLLFKQGRQSEDLFRLGQWMLTISYYPHFIALALQFMAYALYLDGKFEESYAFYFQSLKYDDKPFAGLNEEINGVLTALKAETPYNLSRTDIANLFISRNYRPQPNELVFDTLRDYIVVCYTKREYARVLTYAAGYQRIRPRDNKINSIIKKSIEALN
ncbi:MAG TPA: hypothetical protein VJZ31_01665 [Bacilli bacterium]|nr:hypothetical protein [Bacilli bacterium]